MRSDTLTGSMAAWTEHPAEWNAPAAGPRGAGRKATIFSLAVSLLIHGSLLAVVIKLGFWRTPPKFSVQGGDGGITGSLESGDDRPISNPAPAALPKSAAMTERSQTLSIDGPLPEVAESALLPASKDQLADALCRADDSIIGVSAAEAVDFSMRFPTRLRAQVRDRLQSASAGGADRNDTPRGDADAQHSGVAGDGGTGNSAARVSGTGGVAGAYGTVDGASVAAPDPSSHNLPPRYPAEAKRKRWEGTVTLTFDVTERGDVEDVRVEESSGYAVLDKAAVEAARDWHFTPATEAGRPCRGRALKRVEFALRG